jgi:membrane protein
MTRESLGLFRDVVDNWQRDKVPTLASSLAFFTVISLAPTLILIVAIASFAFGTETVRRELVEYAHNLMGGQGAAVVQGALERARPSERDTIATIIGLGTMIFGATVVFFNLQDALNSVWGVPPKPWRGILGFLRDRFFPLTMVLVLGLLIMFMLLASAALTTLSYHFPYTLPITPFWIQTLNFIVSLAMLTIIFAAVYKILPEVRIAWSDVWVGALFTAFLFSVGKTLIGMYLGTATVGSAYGAAGSLVVLLLWIYYSAQIFFFGAEFTQAYAHRFGSKIVPRAIIRQEILDRSEALRRQQQPVTVRSPEAGE